jgi:hypothetical protein
VIADGSPAALAAQLGVGRLRIDVEPVDRPRAEAVVRSAGASVEPAGAGPLRATGLADVDVPALVAALVADRVRIHAVVPEDASLEDVYFALHARGPR